MQTLRPMLVPEMGYVAFKMPPLWSSPFSCQTLGCRRGSRPLGTCRVLPPFLPENNHNLLRLSPPACFACKCILVNSNGTRIDRDHRRKSQLDPCGFSQPVQPPPPFLLTLWLSPSSLGVHPGSGDTILSVARKSDFLSPKSVLKRRRES